MDLLCHSLLLSFTHWMGYLKFFLREKCLAGRTLTPPAHLFLVEIDSNFWFMIAKSQKMNFQLHYWDLQRYLVYFPRLKCIWFCTTFIYWDKISDQSQVTEREKSKLWSVRDHVLIFIFDLSGHYFMLGTFWFKSCVFTKKEFFFCCCKSMRLVYQYLCHCWHYSASGEPRQS